MHAPLELTDGDLEQVHLLIAFSVHKVIIAPLLVLTIQFLAQVDISVLLDQSRLLIADLETSVEQNHGYKLYVLKLICVLQ